MKDRMIQWLKNNTKSIIVVCFCLVAFVICALWANSGNEKSDDKPANMAEYENGKVIEILKDNTYQDDTADKAWRGEQMLTAIVTTGRYKGETLLVYNYVGPVYSVPVKKGDLITMIISSYADGTHNATVYEINRIPGILIITAIFALTAILIGGKNGAKSLLGLIFIALSLFFILLPALMKGASTILMTFVVCVFIASFSLAIMSGVNRKTVCAFLGTIIGVAAALLFATIAQKILRIDGLRQDDVEALIQLNNSGMNIGLRGLLSAGVIISSLGAIMDVTMGLASSMSELNEANDDLTFKQMFLSGMNIGKDMVGTMTATLILAFLGSSFVLILYLYSLNLAKYQLLSSAFLSTELISSLSSSIGAILSVPITALIGAKAFDQKQRNGL